MAQINCLIVRELNVEVAYRIDGEIKLFSEKVVTPSAVCRYLRLETGDSVGLFVPVDGGRYVNALNIEWFKVERIKELQEGRYVFTG